MSTPPTSSPDPDRPDTAAPTPRTPTGPESPVPVSPPRPPQYGYAPGYPQYRYGPGYPQYGYGPSYAAPPTNGLAIASLVTSLTSLVMGITAPVGLILGIFALRAIQRDGTPGRGFAIAGIVVGAVMTLMIAVSVAFFIFLAAIATVPAVVGLST
ncbi:MAG TPA: DUF4190 domain-containing protein [Pengzhenrongella sp.]